MGLYVEDKSKFNFTTRIQSIVEAKDGNFLVLEKSYFNPSNFPMPSDKGYINGKQVIDVVVKSNLVMHLVDSYSGFTINMPVSCEIDKDIRLDYMIQDSAYHLLNKVISEKFNANVNLITVDDYKSDIYINKVLSERDIYNIENSLNEYIKKDYDVIKKNSKEKDIAKQYIKIGGYDYIDCPYVHVESLKEIQIIKIIKSIKYKDGTKISFLAGERLIRFLRDRDKVIRSIEKESDSYLDEVAFKIRLLKEKNENYEKKYQKLLDEFSSYIIDSYNEEFIIEKINWSEDLTKKIGTDLSIKQKIIVFYNENNFKLFIFTNENIGIDEFLADNNLSEKKRNSFNIIANSNYAEITFKNSLDLKRFVSSIYDKILKYSKNKKGD